MLNALILYRFSHPDACHFVSTMLIPRAIKHFRVITIKAKSDEPGTIDYWLNAFNLADWLADIVISVEFFQQTLSHNIVTEQLSNLAGASGLNNKTTMMNNFRISSADVGQFGSLYYVSITDAPSWPWNASRVSRHSAKLRLGPSGTKEYAPQLDRFCASVSELCKKTDNRFAEKYPTEYKRLMRLRCLFEEDAAFHNNLIFHNAQDAALASTPDPQDEGLRKFVKAMIYGDVGEEPPYKALKVRAMSAHGMFRQDSFEGFRAKVGIKLAGWLPRSFFKDDRNKPIFKFLADCASVVAWPFYSVLRMDLQWIIRFFQIPIPPPPPPPAPDLRSFLIGKWHQEFGGVVCENVLAADGTFYSITVAGPFRQDVTGRWAVRDGNQLWQEWVSWNPMNIPKPLPDGTTIEVLDADHFRNKLGVATRMR